MIYWSLGNNKGILIVLCNGTFGFWCVWA